MHLHNNIAFSFYVQMERTQGEERPFLCEDDDLALNQSDEGRWQIRDKNS